MFSTPTDEMPVFGTHGRALQRRRRHRALSGAGAQTRRVRPQPEEGKLPLVTVKHSSGSRAIVPTPRVRYLAEIAETLRSYHAHRAAGRHRPRERQALRTSKNCSRLRQTANDFDELISWKDGEQSDPKAKKLLDMWPDTVKGLRGDEYVVKIRDKEIRKLVTESLSGTKIRKVVLPTFTDDGEVLKFLMKENVPAPSPSPPASSPSSARARTRPACSPARAMPSAPTAASSASPKACRRSACRRLRLGHAVRLRPGRAPGHLRQDRQLRRLDRHARRHEGAFTTASTWSTRPPRCR